MKKENLTFLIERFRMNINELLGYTGMLFVVMSFAMKDIIWLRILNIIGAIISCAYGFLTKTYPTAILNLILTGINIVYLISYFVKKHCIK